MMSDLAVESIKAEHIRRRDVVLKAELNVVAEEQRRTERVEISRHTVMVRGDVYRGDQP